MGECDPMTCTVVFPEPPEWTEWMNYPTSTERAIHRDEAEKAQIKFVDEKNCRFIHVRGKLVGAVDYETTVTLRLHAESSPALIYGRRGDQLFFMAFLHEWER